VIALPEQRRSLGASASPYTKSPTETKETPMTEQLNQVLDAEWYQGHHWISAEEKLPDQGIRVLGHVIERSPNQSEIEFVEYEAPSWYRYFNEMYEVVEVSHWMELPPKPHTV
jgi:hypothetical protein